MKNFGWVLFLFVALWGGNSAWTQNDEDPCKGEENQLNLNLCAEQKYKKADAQLNATWKELMALTPAEDKEDLKKVQRLWLQFRDAHCAYEVKPWEGGSIVPMIQYGCLLRLTEERTQHLKDLLSAIDN